MAADVLKVSPDALVEERGGIRCGETRMNWPQVLEKYFQMKDASIIGRAYLRKAGDLTLVPVFWEIGVVGVEIVLDEETGSISLETLVTIGDVGLAIHPAMTEGQDLGAATMGLGVGLFEELIYDGQQLMNGTMLEYRVPRFFLIWRATSKRNWCRIATALDRTARKAAARVQLIRFHRVLRMRCARPRACASGDCL